MTSGGFRFEKTSLPEVESCLSSLILDYDESEKQSDETEAESYQRSVARNLIVIADFNPYESWPKEVIELMRFLPGRLILLCQSKDLQLKANEALVTASCWSFSKSEHLCNELVVLSAAELKPEALMNTVLQLRIPAVPSTSYLMSEARDSHLLEILDDFSDELIFESDKEGCEVSLLTNLLRQNLRLIDLSWLKFTWLREEIQRVFQKPRCAEMLPFLEKIDLRGVHLSHDCLSSVYLFLGWIVASLDLEIETFGNHAFHCKDTNDREIELRIDDTKSEKEERILTLHFKDKEMMSFSWKDDLKVSFSSLEGGDQILARVAVKRKEAAKLLETYFAIGESLKAYDISLERGLEMFSLRSGIGLSISTRSAYAYYD